MHEKEQREPGWWHFKVSLHASPEGLYRGRQKIERFSQKKKALNPKRLSREEYALAETRFTQAIEQLARDDGLAAPLFDALLNSIAANTSPSTHPGFEVALKLSGLLGTCPGVDDIAGEIRWVFAFALTLSETIRPAEYTHGRHVITVREAHPVSGRPDKVVHLWTPPAGRSESCQGARSTESSKPQVREAGLRRLRYYLAMHSGHCHAHSRPEEIGEIAQQISQLAEALGVGLRLAEAGHEACGQEVRLTGRGGAFQILLKGGATFLFGSTMPRLAVVGPLTPGLRLADDGPMMQEEGTQVKSPGDNGDARGPEGELGSITGPRVLSDYERVVAVGQMVEADIRNLLVPVVAKAQEYLDAIQGKCFFDIVGDKKVYNDEANRQMALKANSFTSAGVCLTYQGQSVNLFWDKRDGFLVKPTTGGRSLYTSKQGAPLLIAQPGQKTA